MKTMRRTMTDALMSCGAVLLLVLILLAMDGRVREQVALRFETRATEDVAAAGSQMRDLASVVYDAVRERTGGETVVLVFLVAATVLVVFMVRT